MRPKAGAATACLLLDLTEDRADALGQQIYQVSSGQGTHPVARGPSSTASAARPRPIVLRRFDDGVRETHNLGLSVRCVPKFVMKRVRPSGAKLKTADKGCSAFAIRSQVVTIDKRRDARQTVGLETVELLRYRKSAKQRVASRDAILEDEHRRKTIPPRVQFLSDC